LEIKKRISNDEIGEILSIVTEENVSYHHMSVAYVRGKWNNREICGSPMLMAKCCHDLDIIAWLKSGVRPTYVSSMGSRMFFNKHKMPRNAGYRCMVDCSIEEECIYSAKKLHIDHPDRWSFYVWRILEEKGIHEPTRQQKIKSLETDNPHGRCIWRCDNNVVDHQSVTIEFEDGCVATHNMVGGVSKPCRTIHIIGTKGEITGVMEDGTFYVRHADTRPGYEYSEENVTVKVSGDAHGGGDMRLVEDFVRVMQGQLPSISTTRLEDSIYGHLIGYRADNSMLERRFIEIPKL
jgi:predicted dehydrogenase